MLDHAYPPVVYLFRSFSFLIDIVALFTDKSGMNPKENPAIGELAVNIHTAIDQERKLNQNAENALSNLTSNIGKIVQGIMNDVV